MSENHTTYETDIKTNKTAVEGRQVKHTLIQRNETRRRNDLPLDYEKELEQIIKAIRA